MTLLLFDAAYGPDPAACRNAGGIALSHYLTGNYAQTSPQPAATRAAGLGVLFNYEQAIDEEVGASRAAGQAIGQRAVAAMPADCPRDGSVAIYFSVDTNVADPTLLDQAFLGIRDVVKPAFQVRVYGEGAVIDHLVAAGLVDGRQWLSESASFPGFNVNDPNVVLLQNHNTDGAWFQSPVPGTDVNVILDPHALAVWWPDGSPYQGDDMTPDEHNALMTLVNIATTGRIDGDRKAWPYAYTPAAATLNQVQANAAALTALTAAVKTPAPVDVTALATQIVAILGPELAGNLVQAIADHVTLAAKP